MSQVTAVDELFGTYMISAFLDCALEAKQSEPSYELSEDQIQQSYRYGRRSCPMVTIQGCRRSPPWPTSSDPQPGTGNILACQCDTAQMARAGICYIVIAPMSAGIRAKASGATTTKGRIMSWSSCSRMWQWYMYLPQ